MVQPMDPQGGQGGLPYWAKNRMQPSDSYALNEAVAQLANQKVDEAVADRIVSWFGLGEEAKLPDVPKQKGEIV